MYRVFYIATSVYCIPTVTHLCHELAFKSDAHIELTV